MRITAEPAQWTYFQDSVYPPTQENHDACAERLIAQGRRINVQVLNEFTSLAHRKADLGWAEIREFSHAIRSTCTVQTPTEAIHERAVSLAEHYGYTIYDASILAAALRAGDGCTTLFSEDMQPGQRINDRLTIENPFHRSVSDISG